jgi:hypothetical protein
VDVPVSVSLTSFAVRPRGTYRFYATARTEGAPLQTAEIWRALTQVGFGRDLQLWPSGQPSDWPGEDVPPVRAGQIVVRGQGSYTGNQLSTVVHLPSGPTLQIWSVWEHTDAASGQEGLPKGLSAAAPVGLLLLGLLLLGRRERRQPAAPSSAARSRRRSP